MYCMISCKTCEYAIGCNKKSNNFVAEVCEEHEAWKRDEQDFYESQRIEQENEMALRYQMLQSENYDFDYGDVKY